MFTDLFSDQPAKDAAAAKAAGYTAANTAAQGSIDTGLGQATPLYQQAYGDFNTLAGKFGAGQDAYNNATGVNGQAGIDSAASIYKSLPGYSGGLTTGIDAVNRGAAARGDLGGGNTSADTIKFASDYDANKYGSYLSALAPNLAGARSATTGGAAALTGQAAADQAAAAQKAQYGYNSATGIGGANADAALAPYSASQNFWGALMGGANLATKAFSGGFSSPSYGGGNFLTDSYGGSSSKPLPGLSASDYGAGF